MRVDGRKGKLVGGTSDWIILKHKSLNGKKKRSLGSCLGILRIILAV